MTRRSAFTPTSSFRTAALIILFKITLVSFSETLWAHGEGEVEEPTASVDSDAEQCLALVDGEPYDGPIYRTLQINDSIEFFEAQMLADLVAAGELPPVDERVGHDAQVVRPACSLGDYGGTLTGTRSLIGGSHQPMAKWLPPAPYAGDDSFGYVPRLYPNIVKDWEISDEGRLLTLHLRHGMKWSDGMPVTADDFLFWYESILLNETLTPNIPERYYSGGQPMTMRVIDSFTVEYEFVDPKPDVVFQWARHRVLAPKHYLTKYHIEYSPDADKYAHEFGYESWGEWFATHYGSDQNWLYYALPGTPTIDTFVLLSKEHHTEEYERNSYYWKIDTDGNQLPYVDRLVILSHNYEELSLRVISGGIDFSFLPVDFLPSLVENSEPGGYRVLQWRNGSMSTPLAITLNYTHSDPIKRELFNNLDFRRALSLAIDRDEMAESLYFNLSEPWTPSVSPHWTGFESWMSTHYANHDVVRANELLDVIGLKTTNEGMRKLTDGRPLTIRGAFTDASLVRAIELLTWYWADIGITLEIRQIGYDEWIPSIAGDRFDATLTHTGGGAEVLARLRRYPMRLMPPWHHYEYTSESPYMWSDWYTTGGRSGDRPPDEVEELFGHSDWFKAHAHLPPDTQEYANIVHRILELNVEGLYSFGTVSSPPIIVAVNEDIRNVPEDAVWLFGGMQPFNIDTFYFVSIN